MAFLFQFDPHFSLGNLVTIAVIIFGAGGAWWSVKSGQSVTNEKLTDLSSDLKELKTEMHTEYLRAETSKANEALLNQKIDDLTRRVEKVEGHSQPGRKRP